MRKLSLSMLALLVVSQVHAGFTPPTDVTPYKPAANQVTATFLTSAGGVDYWEIAPDDGSPEFGLAVKAGTSLARVEFSGGEDEAWTKFLAATTLPGDIGNKEVQEAAFLWFMAHVVQPFWGAPPK